MTLQELQEKYGEMQIRLRREFHRIPEASLQEHKTAAKIREELDRMGVEWRVCGGPTGTLARIRGVKPGKTILLRGDIDGLEVTEQTGVDYASEHPGFMHACGHDCHISMLLIAVAMVNDIKDRLAGDVVFAFQPAEEIGRGALMMIEDGCLDGVDAAYGMHVWSDFPAGKVSVRTGGTMASGDRFTIKVTGKAGHGAQPHLCADATVIGAAIVQNLQTIVSREISPIETGVVTVGKFESGTRFNVISGEATLIGTTRCFSPEVRKHFPEAMERVAKETARAMRGDAELIYEELVPPTVNNAALAELVRGSAKKVFGEDCLYDYPPTMGGEDFAQYQLRVPGVMVLVGMENAACNAIYGQHHNRYQVDESQLVRAAALHVQVALDFLGVEL